MKALIVFLFATISFKSFTQAIYGNNTAAGHYLKVSDANIYYEIYGSGKPVVLLHGGIWGYIDDYRDLIPVLSKKYQVIVIATRGHGKSELGSEKFSYQLFSEDTYKVIKHVTEDSVIVIGFSDGGDQAYYLAANHPEVVKKLISIGGNFGATDYSKEGKTFMNHLNANYFHAYEKDFMNRRKAIMPDSTRFDEFVNRLADVWRDSVYVTKETIVSIQCPTLIAAGDSDEWCLVETYTALYRLLKKGHLAIIPGSGHNIFIRQPKLAIDIITSFIDEPK
jgi:pimeloyl-ACP methyl ester carboxylesterase